MELTINQVATCGYEILNEENQVIGWSVDKEWAEKITDAIRHLDNMEDKNDKDM